MPEVERRTRDTSKISQFDSYLNWLESFAAGLEEQLKESKTDKIVLTESLVVVISNQIKEMVEFFDNLPRSGND